MSTNQQNRPAQELLNIQQHTEETQEHKENSSTELIHREQIEDTPFYIIGNEEKGYFISFGKYKLTEEIQSLHTQTLQEQFKSILHHQQWNIILNLLAVFTEFSKLDTINYLQGVEKNKGE